MHFGNVVRKMYKQLLTDIAKKAKYRQKPFAKDMAHIDSKKLMLLMFYETEYREERVVVV